MLESGEFSYELAALSSEVLDFPSELAVLVKCCLVTDAVVLVDDGRQRNDEAKSSVDFLNACLFKRNVQPGVLEEVELVHC